jgi:hypothetical protein
MNMKNENLRKVTTSLFIDFTAKVNKIDKVLTSARSSRLINPIHSSVQPRAHLHAGAEDGAVAGDARALLVVLRLRVAHAVELGLQRNEREKRMTC